MSLLQAGKLIICLINELTSAGYHIPRHGMNAVYLIFCPASMLAVLAGETL